MLLTLPRICSSDPEARLTSLMYLTSPMYWGISTHALKNRNCKIISNKCILWKKSYYRRLMDKSRCMGCERSSKDQEDFTE